MTAMTYIFRWKIILNSNNSRKTKMSNDIQNFWRFFPQNTAKKARKLSRFSTVFTKISMFSKIWDLQKKLAFTKNVIFKSYQNVYHK